MIPYVTIDPVTLFGLEIQPFFVLVVLGILAGVFVYDRLCKRAGDLVDPKVALPLPEFCLLGGFLGAHLMHVLFYHPELLSEDPLVLLKIWGGYSSIGGFFGGMLGGLGYLRYKRVNMRPYADRLLFALVVGWVFGRTGCAVTHDHPGIRSDFFLAVKFPGGARHDLGLYELMLTFVILGTLLVFTRRPHRSGTVMALILILYAPVRFFLDFLRAGDVRWADARYWSLTPAQYGCLALLLAGIYLAATRKRHPMDRAYFGKER